jgi:hypothetical protein
MRIYESMPLSGHRKIVFVVALFISGMMLGVAVYAAWTQTHTININGSTPVVPSYASNPSFALTAGVTNGVAQASAGFTTGSAGSGTIAFTNSTTNIMSMTLVLIPAPSGFSCPATAPSQSQPAPVMAGGSTGSPSVPFSLPAGTAYTYCLYYSSGPVTPTGKIVVVYTGTSP